MSVRGKGKAGPATKAKVSAKKSAKGSPRGNGKPNSMLLPTKSVSLEGQDRAFIIRALERIPRTARTRSERALMDKVRGK